jgi:ubiquinone/menaquinone biosynthesis C-methylase UbiE
VDDVIGRHRVVQLLRTRHAQSLWRRNIMRAMIHPSACSSWNSRSELPGHWFVAPYVSRCERPDVNERHSSHGDAARSIGGMGDDGPGGDWSRIASWYDELLASGSGLHETATAALLDLVPELAGADILDVACGQGLATRALAEAGAASVVGVDAAPTMIELAQQRTPRHLPISWRVDDAEHLRTLGTARFDGATCQLGLMDIGNLAGAFGAIRRVLRPRGWFVFVIGHPCSLAPQATTSLGADDRLGRLVTRYFDEEFWRSSNPSGVRGKAGNHHRPAQRLHQHAAGSRVPARRRRRATCHRAPARPAAGVRQRADLLCRTRARRVTACFGSAARLGSDRRTVSEADRLPELGRGQFVAVNEGLLASLFALDRAVRG